MPLRKNHKNCNLLISDYVVENQKKIVIAGASSTGKTSLINELMKRGYACKEETSRKMIREGKKKGIGHFFLTHPISFSEQLLTQRIFDFKNAEESNEGVIFFDRGLPEVVGYLEYIGETLPNEFVQKCKMHQYNNPIFVTPVWKEIHRTDDERYESYEEAKKIDRFLRKAYLDFNYTLIDIPLTSVEERVQFILETLKKF